MTDFILLEGQWLSEWLREWEEEAYNQNRQWGVCIGGAERKQVQAPKGSKFKTFILEVSRKWCNLVRGEQMK